MIYSKPIILPQTALTSQPASSPNMKFAHFFQSSRDKKAAATAHLNPAPSVPTECTVAQSAQNERPPILLPTITLRPPTPPDSRLTLSDLVTLHDGLAVILHEPPAPLRRHKSHHTTPSPPATGYLQVPSRRRGPRRRRSVPALQASAAYPGGDGGCVRAQDGRGTLLAGVEAPGGVARQHARSAWQDEVAWSMMLGPRGTAAFAPEIPPAGPMVRRLSSRRSAFRMP